MVEADNERAQWNGKRRGATKGLRTTLGMTSHQTETGLRDSADR
jgi:hypothetical protein